MPPEVSGPEVGPTVKKTSGAKANTDREKFLSKCSSLARSFFSALLDLADQRGHVTYWGREGFTARVLMKARLITVLYCHPSGRVEINLHNIPIANEEVLVLTQELLGI